MPFGLHFGGILAPQLEASWGQNRNKKGPEMGINFKGRLGPVLKRSWGGPGAVLGGLWAVLGRIRGGLGSIFGSPLHSKSESRVAKKKLR